MAIIVAMYGGIVGFLFHKQWFAGLLKSGSWLALLQALHALYVIFRTLEGEPTPFVVLGILTDMLPLNAWPVILLIWLQKLKTTNVDEIMGNPVSEQVDKSISSSEIDESE